MKLTSEDVSELNIRQMKLMNGEEIIGLIASDNHSNYLIERPLVVRSLPQHIYRFQLVPWFALSSTNLVTIEKSNIISHAEADVEIKVSYLELCSEGYDAERLFEEDQYELFDDEDEDDTTTTKVVH